MPHKLLEKNRYKCTYATDRTPIVHEFSFELEQYKPVGAEALRILRLTAEPGYVYHYTVWLLTPAGQEFVLSGMESIMPPEFTA